jgi:septal ring factor EnvC (AmiA/AmiB activator)
MLENKLASVEKELQQVKNDNVALARYINARRKNEEDRRKEEARKKAKEEAQRKGMVVVPTSDEGQSSKDVRTWRKYSSKGGPMTLPPPD